MTNSLCAAARTFSQQYLHNGSGGLKGDGMQPCIGQPSRPLLSQDFPWKEWSVGENVLLRCCPRTKAGSGTKIRNNGPWKQWSVGENVLLRCTLRTKAGSGTEIRNNGPWKQCSVGENMLLRCTLRTKAGSGTKIRNNGPCRTRASMHVHVQARF